MPIYRVTTNGTYDGQVIQNAWHVSSADFPTQAEIDALMDATHEAWNARIAANMVWANVTVRQVDIPEQVGTVITPTGWPLVGGAGAVDGLPGYAGVRLIGAAVTTTYPRRFRKWLCGVREDDTTRGNLTAGAVTSWNTALNTTRTYIAAATDLVIVTTKYSIGADPVVVAFNPIESIDVVPTLGMQRRRRIGRGI